MAFVPEFEYDVFVSYAHLDNEPILEQQDTRWVNNLKGYLQNVLNSKLGSRASIWMDVKGLAGHQHLTPEIHATICHSATLLVILSPGYIASDWCRQELDVFRRSRSRGWKDFCCRSRRGSMGRLASRFCRIDWLSIL